MKHPLTQERLLEFLDYNPDSGLFTWRVYRNRDARQGDIAGHVATITGGRKYIRIRIDRRQYFAQRLAWLYMMGAWPDWLIDHADNDGLNNRWLNLRQATVSQNSANRKRARLNTTGFKGATLLKSGTRRYQAQITVRGNAKYLGVYSTPEDAHAAYLSAAEHYFGEFARAE